MTPKVDVEIASGGRPSRSKHGGNAFEARTSLRRAESRELFRRWQKDRDQAARDQLVERFLPLARQLARRYPGGREPFEDRLQVATLGLLKALNRFDPARGTAFSSFAVPTIVGELKRYFRDLGWSVHVPRSAQELAMRVQRAEEALSTKTGRSPTIHDLAQHMEASIEDVLDGLEAAAAHYSDSLEAPHDDGDGNAYTLADTMGADDNGFDFSEHRVTLAGALQSLCARDRHVLALRFFGDLTQAEIAKKIGVSQMQVSRILREAISDLHQLTFPAVPDPADPAEPDRR